MKRPSADDMHTAAMWLDVYEGADDRDACLRVREWLLAQADAAELRAACKEAGVSVVAARRGIARQQRVRAGSDDPT